MYFPRSQAAASGAEARTGGQQAQAGRRPGHGGGGQLEAAQHAVQQDHRPRRPRPPLEGGREGAEGALQPVRRPGRMHGSLVCVSREGLFCSIFFKIFILFYYPNFLAREHSMVE